MTRDDPSILHGFDLGGRLVRNDLDIAITGREATALVGGLYIAGDGQHIDNHVRIDHRVGPARSEQEYRGILGGRCRCVWNGKTIVQPGADGTDRLAEVAAGLDDEIIVNVQGDEPLIEGFVIDEYAAGFVDLGTPDSSRAICGIDDKENAICYETSHPVEYDHARAVARLLINGSSLCTGWLASSNNHLLTNEHCISSAASALNTDLSRMLWNSGHSVRLDRPW